MFGILSSLAAGFVLLAVGGEALVRGSSMLGMRVGISPLVVGLTIVAFGTSAPEMAVSLQAALAGSDELAVGNVVGSNIANVGLILGMAALIRPGPLSSKLVRQDVPIMIAASLLVGAMLLDGHISRPEGAVLLAGIVAYTAYSVRHSRSERRRVKSEYRQELGEDSPGVPACVLATVLGIGALVVGGKLFVIGAVGIAHLLGVSEAVIGLTIVAIGTSLPEMATTVVASLRGHSDIAAGNVVGSNIFNLLSILGFTAVIHPLARGGVGPIDIGIMIVLGALPLPFMLHRGGLARWEGAGLLLCYAAYVFWLL